MDKLELIEQLKLEYPTLTKQIGDEVITLDENEYEQMIDSWAIIELAKQEKETEMESKVQAKIELLERLGITEDEAKLLLA